MNVALPKLFFAVVVEVEVYRDNLALIMFYICDYSVFRSYGEAFAMTFSRSEFGT